MLFRSYQVSADDNGPVEKISEHSSSLSNLIDMLVEEYIGTRGGVKYYQMGGSLPDNLYNVDKSGKSTRDPGVDGLKKSKRKRAKRKDDELEKDLDKKEKKGKRWYQTESKQVNEAYYHGTSTLFKPGEYILPPSETGNVSEKGRKKNLDKVFFTKDLGSAKIYAGRAKHSLGGEPKVYLIEPEGEDRKSTRLNSSHSQQSRMPSSA